MYLLRIFYFVFYLMGHTEMILVLSVPLRGTGLESIAFQC